MTVSVKTNNHARELVSFVDATGSRGFDPGDFDYVEEDEHYTPRLFRYRGCWYDVDEFVRIVPAGSIVHGFEHCDHSGELVDWDGIQTDSYFSAVVLRYARDDCGNADPYYVVVGTLTS